MIETGLEQATTCCVQCHIASPLRMECRSIGLTALLTTMLTNWHVLTTQVEPKATEYISEMISTIQDIINNGHAYPLPDGDVYFDVASLPGYGRLSGRKEVRRGVL